MADRLHVEQSASAQPPARVCRDDWLRDSILSGFVATFAMSVVLALAYGVALALGVHNGNTTQRWFWALTHNPVTRTTQNAVVLAIILNMAMGLIWAVIYGRWVEPRLGGPGWQRGMLFALIPWLLSIVAFLPVMGAGFLGFAIGAGPLPLIGNLILHLVYGAVLGSVYAIALESGLDDAEAEGPAAEAAERGAAIGVAAGIVVGGLVGWGIGPSVAGVGTTGEVVLGVALVGAAIGILFGSLLGMARAPRAMRSAEATRR